MGDLFEISSVDGRSKYATMQTGTTIEMLNYTDMTVGSKWYDTTLHKVWVWTNQLFWMVEGECQIMNKIGGDEILKGQLVVPESTLTNGCMVADLASTEQIIGINVWTVEAEETCVIAYAGVWDVLCSDDSNPYSVGQYLVHDGSPSAEDGQAKRRTTGTGHMGLTLEAGSVAGGGGLLKCQVQPVERY